MVLRDYQKDIVTKVLATNKNEVVGLPTGSGKTVVAKAIIDGLKETVVFIAPRIDLVLQSKDTFGDVDVIWSSRTDVTGKHCIVASKQSLLNRMKLVPANSVLIIDECHIGMEKNAEIVAQLKPRRVIGLTATPETMSGASFIKGTKFDKGTGIYDEVNYYYPISELQNMGYLAPLETHYYNYKTISKVKTKSFDEELRGKAFRDFIAGPQGRLGWKHLSDALNKCKDKPTIIFTPDIATAEDVVKFASKEGLNFEVITGEASVEERTLAYDKLANHTINGLVNAALLTYGFDCPAAKNVILFRHIKSRPLYVQIVGRVLRPYNNETAHLYDVLDSNSEFVNINQLDMFSQPIDWRYEGFDSDVQKELDAADRERLETMSAKFPSWIDEYNKDPIKALWKLYEDTIDSAEEKYFEFQTKISESAAKFVEWEKAEAERKANDAKIAAEKAKAKAFEAEEKAKAALENKMSYYLSNVYRSEMKYMVPNVLRNAQYDCSQYNERYAEMLKLIWNEVPPEYRSSYTQYDVEKFAKMTDWWLRNFKINYTKYQTERQMVVPIKN